MTVTSSKAQALEARARIRRNPIGLAWHHAFVRQVPLHDRAAAEETGGANLHAGLDPDLAPKEAALA